MIPIQFTLQYNIQRIPNKNSFILNLTENRLSQGIKLKQNLTTQVCLHKFINPKIVTLSDPRTEHILADHQYIKRDVE